jgi:hypothetical protein
MLDKGQGRRCHRRQYRCVASIKQTIQRNIESKGESRLAAKETLSRYGGRR